MHRLLVVALIGAACAGRAPVLERAAASVDRSPSAATVPPSGAATVVGSAPRAPNASAPPSPSATATPAATPEPDVPACTASQLEARATAQPGTGGWQLLGAIIFFNRGTAPCGLRGAPAVRPIDPAGALIDVEGAEPVSAGHLVVVGPSSATWAPPESAPPGSAVLTFAWSGACLERGAVAFRVMFPGARGTLDAPFLSLVGERIGAPGAMPRCAEPGRTFAGHLAVDPFFAMGE